MIRATKIEIWRFCDGDKERRETWRHLAEQVQRMQNRMWQIWLVYHVQNDSAETIKGHLDRYAEWKAADKKTRGPKPKWEVQAIGKELSNKIYHALSDEFGDVHVRTRGLLQNKWQQTVNQRKAARGNLPGWVSILFAHESLPSTTKPQPIPFDKMNCLKGGGLIKAEDKYYLDCCIEREDDGKSVRDKAELIMNRRGMHSIRVILDRIMAGEYTFKGSSLVYKKGKWFASISYEQPVIEHPQLDMDKTIELIPGKATPWIVRKQRDAFKYFGSGRHVTHFRKMIQSQRWSRQEHNRWGSSATKGRGRNRAEAAWTKLSSRWKDFVNTYNNRVTTRLIEMAVAEGIGRIVYYQPMDDTRDKTFLATRGKHAKSRMTWDWFQVGTQLKYKAEAFGIEVEIVKRREQLGDANTNGKKPAKKQAATKPKKGVLAKRKGKRTEATT